MFEDPCHYKARDCCELHRNTNTDVQLMKIFYLILETIPFIYISTVEVCLTSQLRS